MRYISWRFDTEFEITVDDDDDDEDDEDDDEGGGGKGRKDRLAGLLDRGGQNKSKCKLKPRVSWR